MISERQQVTAVRVANIPQDKFDAAIEAPKPAAGRDDPADVLLIASRAFELPHQFAEVIFGHAGFCHHILYGFPKHSRKESAHDRRKSYRFVLCESVQLLG